MCSGLTHPFTPPYFNTMQVTPEQRQAAKGLTYGLLYGMGEARLGRYLGITESEAARLRREFMERFPRLREYLEGIRRQLGPDCTFVEVSRAGACSTLAAVTAAGYLQ